MCAQFRYEVDEKTTWVEYDEYVDSPIQVQIRYLDDDEHQRMINKSTVTIFAKHRSDKELDNAKLRKALVKYLIVEMKAKVKDLQKLVIPKIKLTFEGDPDKDLVYDSSVGKILEQYAHGEFIQFLMMKARELNDFVGNEKEEEIENLGRGSGSKEVPKDLPKSK